MRRKLVGLTRLLFDQEQARVIVPPEQNAPGFWFGGGKMVEGPAGELVVTGRYRNAGDSRQGLRAGERGKELAVYRSTDQGRSFEKIARWSKHDLNVGDREVLSIEGSALSFDDDGVRLYVSTEKNGIGYPEGLDAYHKPGTGVWTVDVLHAPSLQELKTAVPAVAVGSERPESLHVKDPFLFSMGGSSYLGFCTHPYTWASACTGIATRQKDGSWIAEHDVFPRGPSWDVAISRGTAVMPVPRLGAFASSDLHLMFYDGGECMRSHEEHGKAHSRPRGYSCEELGGVAVISRADGFVFDRLSLNEPAMVSPWGTGCARYAHVVFSGDRAYASWQQSRADGSQPLVMHSVEMADIEKVLS